MPYTEKYKHVSNKIFVFFQTKVLKWKKKSPNSNTHTVQALFLKNIVKNWQNLDLNQVKQDYKSNQTIDALTVRDI